MLTWHCVINALYSLGLKWNYFEHAFQVSRGTVNNWRKAPTRTGIKTDKAYLFDGLQECYKKLHSARLVTDYDNFVESFLKHLSADKEEKAQLWEIYQKRGAANPEVGFHDLRDWLATMAREGEVEPEKPPADEPNHPYDPTSAVRPVAAVGMDFILAADANRHVLANGENSDRRCAVLSWADIVAVAACCRGSVGLRSDGSCLAAGDDFNGSGTLFQWRGITALAAGNSHVLGLTRDGRVLAFGDTDYEEHYEDYGEIFKKKYEVTDWTGITGIAAGRNHSVGLKSDGSAVAVGEDTWGQLQVTQEKIIQVAAARDHTIVLTEEDTGRKVYGCGDLQFMQLWRLDGSVMIATGEHHAVGLREDGSVAYTGADSPGLQQVERWCDMIALSAGFDATIGIRRDGRVLIAQSEKSSTVLNAKNWRLFVVPESVQEEVVHNEFNRKLSAVIEQTEALCACLSQSPDRTRQPSAFSEAYDRLLDLEYEIFEMYDDYPNLTDIHLLCERCMASFLFLDNTVVKKDECYETTAQSYDACESFLGALKRLEQGDADTALPDLVLTELTAEEKRSPFSVLLQKFSLPNFLRRNPQ